MTLPVIPDDAWEAAHDGDFYNRAESVRLSVEAAWPHLYAAALRHAADALLDGSVDADLEVMALRRMADEADNPRPGTEEEVNIPDDLTRYDFGAVNRDELPPAPAPRDAEDCDRQARTLDDGSDAGGYIVPPAMLAAHDRLLALAAGPPDTATETGLRQPSDRGYWMHREDESRCEPSQIDGAAATRRVPLTTTVGTVADLMAARDAALAETARVRADVAVEQILRLSWQNRAIDAEDQSTRLTAALGRVEALCDEADAHKKREPYYAWVRSSDLRAAIGDAGTDEGRQG